jgi:hypothetical protein
VQFAGYSWDVKIGNGKGPGPNNWNANNVWVDGSGRLHLRVTNSSGTWTCAGVGLPDRLGFGSYQFQVIGAIDTLDPNVVLGLFDYPTSDVGPDGTNEIDIEFSRWGNPQNYIGNYTVYPAVAGNHSTSSRFPVSLNGTYTTHRFFRSSTSVSFESVYGHTSSGGTAFGSWTFSPANPNTFVPQSATPVRMNLWLFHGMPPTNGQPVEIIVSDFSFSPM